MATLELYGSQSCPYTAELRQELLWKGRDFTEYDVEEDPEALQRMRALAPGQRMVPLLVEEGRVTHVGWQGRGCYV